MKKIAGCLWLCLLAACSQQPATTALETIHIDVDSEMYQEGKAAFESFTIVELDNENDNALLRDVSKVVASDDRLYVLSMFDPRVFIFTTEGKYINSLKKGQGPGEVIFASDMAVRNGELYVLDMYRTIRKYDKDGKYIEDVYTTDDPHFSFNYVGDHLLMFDPNLNKRSDYMLSVVSADQTRRSYLPKEETLKECTFMNTYFMNDDLIAWPYCDTVYQYCRYEGDSISVLPRYQVDFAGRNFYDLMKDETFTPQSIGKLTQDKTSRRWLRDVAPYGESSLFFAFNYDKTYFVRHTPEGTSLYSEFVKGLPELVATAVGHTDGQLIYTFPSHALLDYKETMESPSHPVLKSLYERVNEDTNPVLVFVGLE